MYFELNIQLPATRDIGNNTKGNNVSDSFFEKEYPQLISSLVEAGYRGIAINRIVEGKLPSSPPLPSLPKWIYSIAEKQCLLAGVAPNTFRIYSRVTLILDSNSASIGLQERSPSLSNIDIIAVQPLTEKALLSCCINLDIDIIQIPVEERLPFTLKPSIIRAAIARGIFFESSLKGTIVPGESSPSRLRAFLSNTAVLISASKGKNLILTTGAMNRFGVKSPHDSANLLHVLGMKSASEALLAMKENPLRVVQRAAMRRMSYKGVVGIMPDSSAVEEHAKIPVDSIGADFIFFAEREATSPN